MKAQLIILLAVYGITQATLSKFDCNLGKDCMCMRAGAEYMFKCPKYESKLTIRISANYEIEIDCGSAAIDWNSEYIPMLKGSATSITFVRCHLSGIITKVIRKLVTNGTQELIIAYSNFNSTLTFDHLENLETLALIENNIEDIQIPFTLSKLAQVDLGASKIRGLNLSEKKLKNWPVGLLGNLPELKTLFLHSNQLTKLDKTVFRNLHNLQVLDLSINQLADLPEDIFHEFKRLTHLSLASNKLNSIPANLFAKNKVLELINLKQNQDLVTLPDGLFSNLTELQTVLLDTCNLSKLPGNLFYGCTQLHTITLEGNQLEELPKDIFKDLTGLEDLDLSYNKLTDLPPEIFSSLTELKSLNLESNMLTEISETLFYNLQNLEVLNLNNNLIGFISSEAFVRKYIFIDLTGLKYLDLSYNKLTDLPPKIFSSLTKLKYLNLESNMLTEISETLFYNLQNLEVLNLNNNLIGFISSEAFVRIVSLKEVVLSNNYLDIFEDEGSVSPFKYNPFLEKVDLSHNNITHVGDGWCWWDNPVLKELDLSYNLITFVNLVGVLEMSLPLLLNLSNNKICTVNLLGFEDTPIYSSSYKKIIVDLNANPMNCNCGIYDFIGYLDTRMTHLEVLADNLIYSSHESTRGLSTCPENCECSIRLWDKAFIINCTNKNLTNIPELVLPQQNIFNQIVVYLQQNLLEEGPKAGMGYENVTTLYLSSNKINEVTWIPPNIELLHLDKNNISHLSNDALSMLNISTLTNIALGNNPWRCVCSDLNLNEFLMRSIPSKQIDVDDIKCKRNREPLLSSDLCPNYRYLILGILIVIELLVLTFTVIIYSCKDMLERFVPNPNMVFTRRRRRSSRRG